MKDKALRPHIFEKGDQLGGKLAQTIPWERLPRAVWEMEEQQPDDCKLLLDAAPVRHSDDFLKRSLGALPQDHFK